MTSRRRPPGIGLVLAAAIALLIGLLIGTTTAIDLIEQQRKIRESADDHGSSVARALNDVLADAMYFGDVERLRNLAEVLRSQPEVRFVEVFDPSGRLLVSADGGKFAFGKIENPAALEAIVSGRQTAVRGRDSLDVFSPIQVSGEVIGGIRLALDQTAQVALLRRTIRDHLWQALVMLLLGLTLAYLLARYLTRPIERLARAADEIAEGNLDVHLDRSRRDELGALAAAFDDMADHLRTARRQTELHTAELEQTNQLLQGEVTKRECAQADTEDANRRLSVALDELKRTQQEQVRHERLRTVGQMAAGVAHDLNNTLQMLSLGCEELRHRLSAGADPVALGAMADRLALAAHDGAEVVRRLGRFHRSSADPRDRKRVRVDQTILEAVRLSSPRWRDQVQATGRRVDLEVEVEPLETAVNESELREAVVNLIFNAVDAIEGSGSIRVTAEADSEEDKAIISIADTGRGMTEAELASCLDPFFSTKPEGTGLGLTSVHTFVHGHQGRLDIESTVGRGTTISICLPLSAPPTEALRVEDAPTELRSAAESVPRSILLVDDEPQLLSLLTQLLERDGHRVSTASNASTATDLFRRQPFDLVITDRAMPDASGDQLAERIRAQDPTVAIILLTGFGDLMNAAREKPEAVDLVLGKPISAADLRRAIAGIEQRVADRAAVTPSVGLSDSPSGREPNSRPSHDG